MSDLDMSFALRDQDVILFNSLAATHLTGLVEWAVRRKSAVGAEQVPRMIIVLHASLRPNLAVDEVRTLAFHNAFGLIESHGLADRFFLYADSAMLAAEYRLVTPMAVGVLPIPHTAAALPDHPPNQIPRISFLGTAFRDRGFHLLPHLVNHLLPAIAAKKACLEIQAQMPPWRDPLLDNAHALLRQSPVTLQEHSLPRDDYLKMLARSDIAVIPSSRAQYHAQTSGVFAEAVSFGKIPVIPDGTWMSLMAETYQIGVTFEAGNIGSLCRAVDQALEQRETLAVRSRAAAPEWIKMNSPHGLIGVLAERIGGLFPA
jgi:hypothetical protein